MATLTVKPQRIGARAGFTLIEIVVVIVIVGIILGMMTVNLRPNDSQTLKEEAKRLALLLEMTQEEAITTGQPFGWTFTSGGEYHFWNLDDKGEWKRLQDDEFFHDGSLDNRVRLTALKSGGADLKTDDRLVFPPAGNITPFEITLVMNKQFAELGANAIGKISVNFGTY